MKNKKNIVLVAIISLITLLVIVLLISKKNPTDDIPDVSETKENSKEMSGTFTDERDQKTYKWIKIGDQTWMAENLAFKPESGYWSYGDSEDNMKTYGYLYDWQTAQGIAPEGWHIPSKTEWETLYKSLGDDPAGQLREKGTEHWLAPNTGATNSSHFTALPGGGYFDGEYLMMGKRGFFWSSTEIDNENAYALTVEENSGGISWYSGTKVRGLSVRCIMDN